MPDTANIVLSIYDGARNLFPNSVRWSAQTKDSRSTAEGQQVLDFPDLKGGTQVLEVSFYDNSIDLLTVTANVDGYGTSAWFPVHVSDQAPVNLDLMLLAKNSVPHFANATWEKLLQTRSNFATIIQRGCKDAADAAAKYAEVLEQRPDSLACFLNIMASLLSMRLPSNNFALDYYWNIAWPDGDPTDPKWFTALDEIFAQDRFFCYVDQAIVQDVRNGKGHGFSQEANPQAFHGDATESYKQTQFEVANVQLTFHGHDTKAFVDEKGREVQCVKIEPDIDYYKDLAAHGLLEVIPNWIEKKVGKKGLTDPSMVYMLRWMATRSEGLMDFNPLYTVEPVQGGIT